MAELSSRRRSSGDLHRELQEFKEKYQQDMMNISRDMKFLSDKIKELVGEESE